MIAFNSHAMPFAKAWSNLDPTVDLFLIYPSRDRKGAVYTQIRTIEPF
jgi:hypothetical protein